MIGKWNDEEVKSLFGEVEKTKSQNASLKKAFDSHAQKFGRKSNSVRNYYYHEIGDLQKDSNRANKLGINLANHRKTNIVYFSQDEETSLMEQINQFVNSGMSVRGACMTLAKGDAQTLLRYQNKYRNYIAKNKQSKGVQTNIIEFKKPSKTLGDNDIQALFMGLVRLVKRTASIEGEEKYKQKINHANNLLRKALADLQAQEREIDKLKYKYTLLKNENAQLADSLLKLRCDKANKLREKLERSKPTLSTIDQKQKEI